MQKLVGNYLDTLLSGWSVYRRQKGGTWYLVLDWKAAAAFGGTFIYWTRDARNLEIIKTEE